MRPTYLRCLALLLSTFYSLHSMADEVTIVSDRWYPFNGIPNAPDPGYMIEMARYGLSRGGHTLNYQIMSWQNSMDLVRQGKKNCIVGAYKSDAPDFIYSQQHQAVDRMAFYIRADEAWHYQKSDSLHNKRLGVINGYAYQRELDIYIANNTNDSQVKKAKGKYALENNLLDLIAGRLDVVLGSEIVIERTLKKQHWQQQIQLADYATPPSKIYIACSPKLPSSIAYLELINQGIEELRSTGQLQSLLMKYQMTDWHGIEALDQ